MASRKRRVTCEARRWPAVPPEPLVGEAPRRDRAFCLCLLRLWGKVRRVRRATVPASAIAVLLASAGLARAEPARESRATLIWQRAEAAESCASSPEITARV